MNPNKIPESPGARKLRLFLEEQGWKRGWKEGLSEGKVQGFALGQQESLLTLLFVRGLLPSRENEERIRACSDPATLGRWIKRAATAASVREVLGAKSSPPARRKAQGKARAAHAAR
jgi:hypothetical protein